MTALPPNADARSGSRLIHVQAPALHKAGALVMVETNSVPDVSVRRTHDGGNALKGETHVTRHYQCRSGPVPPFLEPSDAIHRRLPRKDME
ncbi:hypothetical protein KL86DES1_20774 [uncultured Desulfovibrio sp.]|uniref:Uncharacterized protein n=1 Tax=uncultured Desulfovibrio sp. TaxID=167968 RepID=A0A212L528_9BACT|nr:hypothetical protein KL86DES1_20774 [uncultured Desulfovibrio sp.]VZH33675.1 conserved protein of unknown function [Desulfovibrio sp. 86]